MALSRPGVESGSDEVAVPLGDVAHTDTLREVLADEAVEVLNAASLPGVIRCGEVAAQGEAVLECLIAMELGAIVEGDGLEVLRPFSNNVECG